MFKDKQAREFLGIPCGHSRLVLGGRYVEPTSAIGELIQQMIGLQERIIDLEYLLDVVYYPTFLDPDNKKSFVIDKFFQLASTLGYEYKEESKEAGWVKKEPFMPTQCGCIDKMFRESIIGKPKKTRYMDSEVTKAITEAWQREAEDLHNGTPIKKPKKTKSK